MKSQSSKLLPLFCALLAIGIATAAWFFLRAAPTAEPGVGSGDERVAATPSGVEDRSADSLETPDLPASTAPTPAQQKVEDRKNVATPAELELADALWVSGRLIYPEGTPIGEEVEVVASGRKFKTRPPYRARVAANGTFRVAFAPGTKAGSVDVDAPHLYLREAVKVKPADPKRTDELVLEPLVGGRIQGQLIVPAGGLSLASQLTGKSVRAQGWSESFDDHMSRSGAVDGSVRFELRGLSPKCAFTLGFHSELFVAVNRADVRVAAGEDLALQLPLTLGARVRGRVSDAAGEKLTSSHLEFRTLQDEQAGDTSSSVEVIGIHSDPSVNVKLEPDGSFDARGILPGKIQVTANSPQRLPALLELGMLGDGEVREGVELVLELGGRIGGRVLWPDGSPAAEARVSLQALQEGNEIGGGMQPFFFDVANVRADAQGAFLISGLAAKKFKVLAQAKPEVLASARGGSKGKPQPLRASYDDVPVDKLDLELKLHSGSTIQGIVVDDVGAPVTRFSVSAEQQTEGYDPLAHTAGSIYTPADGRFELSGLLDASYRISVTAAGHDDPEDAEITVPADSGTLNFVARRRARVSGVVLRPDGKPAGGAEVSVSPPGEFSSPGGDSKSNSRGEFSVKSASTGSVLVRARLGGFASSEELPAELAPGESRTNLLLQLRTGGRITGEVHALKAGEDLGGRAIEGLDMEHHAACSGVTDASGHFVIEHVDPGDYTLTLEPGLEQIAALVTPEDNEWDSDLRDDLERHVSVSVVDTMTTHAVFAAPTRASVALSGTVRRAGKPAGSVRLRCAPIADDRDGDVQYARSDASGRYEFALNGAGRYLVQAQPAGSDGTSIGLNLDVPAGGRREVDFTLPGGRIAGSVVGPGGVELDSAYASLSFRGSGVNRLVVKPENSQHYSSAFDFENLPAGTYTLEVRASASDIVLPGTATKSDIDSLGTLVRDFSLAEDQQIVDLRIELSAGATLVVHVRLADGSAAVEGVLDLWRADSPADEPTWRSFEDGLREEDELEPGSYQLRARSGDLVSAAPTRVELVAGQSREVTLVLGTSGRLRFDVRDSHGETIAAHVQVYDAGGRALLYSPETEGEAGPLAPGACRVVATDSAGRRAQAHAQVVAGETTGVLLKFE